MRSLYFAASVLAVVLEASSAPAAISTTERNALIDLFNGTAGASWTNHTNWNGAAGTECTWFGVVCNGAQTAVTQLNLNDNHVVGTLSTSLGDLGSMADLNIGNTSGGAGDNQLSGSIPASLGGLIGLTHLNLGGNQLSGSIPSALGDLTSLTSLNLSSNHLSGSIPAELGNLLNLVELDLSGNQLLTGSIPAPLANLTALQTVRLGDNQLSGSIPAFLGDLMSLQTLSLGNNLFTGSIPTALGNLLQLQVLELNDNQLSGSIPSSLGNLTQLTSLALGFNQLSGSIPAELGNLLDLTSLSLFGNQLSGTIPTSLENLTQLPNDGLDLRYNELHTDDATLLAFLNSKQYLGDWESTQTVPPTGVAAGSPSVTSVTVSWTPILYTGDSGGYRVLFGTTSGGPYAPFPTLTADKSATSLQVTGLSPGTPYFFVVETQTNPHTLNQNTLVSAFSAETFASTLAGPAATLTVAPMATPTPMNLSLGEPCSAPIQCSSGFCAQSVCCDRMCGGPREACNLPDGAGTCQTRSARPAPALSPAAFFILGGLFVAVAWWRIRELRRSSRFTGTPPRC